MIEHYSIHPEASSNVKWARYDPVHDLLEVDFKSAAGEYQSTYEYGDRGEGGRRFTRQDWEDFRSAPRPGVFFAERIRGKYPYRKITRKPDAEKEPAPEQERLF
jgi:hypothetical protein